MLMRPHQRNTLTRLLQAKQKFASGVASSTTADKENAIEGGQAACNADQMPDSKGEDHTQVGAFLRQA